MSKEQLWLQFIAKNPHFADPKAESRLTSGGLKKLFDTTYNIGFAEGGDQRSAKEKSFFDKIFGPRPF